MKNSGILFVCILIVACLCFAVLLPRLAFIKLDASYSHGSNGFDDYENIKFDAEEIQLVRNAKKLLNKQVSGAKQYEPYFRAYADITDFLDSCLYPIHSGQIRNVYNLFQNETRSLNTYVVFWEGNGYRIGHVKYSAYNTDSIDAIYIIDTETNKIINFALRLRGDWEDNQAQPVEERTELINNFLEYLELDALHDWNTVDYSQYPKYYSETIDMYAVCDITIEEGELYLEVGLSLDRFTTRKNFGD